MTDWDNLIDPAKTQRIDIKLIPEIYPTADIKQPWPIELTGNNPVSVIVEPLPIPNFIGLDLGTKDQTVAAVFKDGVINKVYNNKMPTHDPYSNPDALIYYQCGCGAILDPHTKSFASLNNAAMNEGWKVRWNKDGSGYQPFCVECGEGVE